MTAGTQYLYYECICTVLDVLCIVLSDELIDIVLFGAIFGTMNGLMVH